MFYSGGSPIEFAEWSDNEPDNTLGAGGGCVAIDPVSKFWSDVDCSSELEGFIVEHSCPSCMVPGSDVCVCDVGCVPDSASLDCIGFYQHHHDS